MFTYAIHIEPDGDGFLVTCPDLPEVTTDADRIEDAPARAADAISEALAARLDDFDPIPRPSRGETMSGAIEPYIAIKSLLAIRMSETGMNRAQLAERLGWHRNSVDRLFKPRHATKLDQFTAAFQALDAQLSFDMVA